MIDLDAKRAERREAKGEAPVLRVNGEYFTLPVEMPYEALEAYAALFDPATQATALSTMAHAILGPHYDKVVGGGFSADDFNELLGGVMEEYGMKNPLDSSGS